MVINPRDNNSKGRGRTHVGREKKSPPLPKDHADEEREKKSAV